MEWTLIYQKALELTQGLQAEAKNLRELHTLGTQHEEDSSVASNTQEVYGKCLKEKGNQQPPVIAMVSQGHVAAQCHNKEAVCHQYCK